MEDVELRTERLLLRPHGTQYLDSTYEYSSDMENTRYMVFLPDFTIDETRKFLADCQAEWEKQDPDFLEFAVLLKNIHIGAVGLYFNENRDTAELGWILHPAYHSRGYVTEAAKEIVRFAEERLGITHFIAHCDTENAASRKVMEKLGMKRSGCSGGRKNKISDEERQDYLYEMQI